MDIILYLGVATLCGIVPTVITLWLNEKVKGSVQNSFNTKLEEIKKEHSKEIAQFQTELNYLKSNESFKFTKLHEKRFEILAETYSYLSQNLFNLNAYLVFVSDKNVQDLDDKKSIKIETDFWKTFTESSDYINRNMLFFNDKIEFLLVNYFSKCAEFFKIYDQFKNMQKKNIEENLGLTIELDSSYKKLEESILPLKKELEKEFRKFLGE